MIPCFWHSIAVNIMCVESIECTKVGGKAVVFFDLLTGWSSRLSAVFSDCKIVWITVVDEIYL